MVNALIFSLCRSQAFDAVFQVDNIEVYKQFDGFTTELEIGKNLRVKDTKVHEVNLFPKVCLAYGVSDGIVYTMLWV